MQFLRRFTLLLRVKRSNLYRADAFQKVGSGAVKVIWPVSGLPPGSGFPGKPMPYFFRYVLWGWFWFCNKTLQPVICFIIGTLPCFFTTSGII